MATKKTISTDAPWPAVDAHDQRIGVVLLTSGLERGGAERQVVQLANSLDPRAFRTYVVSLSNDNPLADDLKHKDSRFIVLPKRSKYDFGLIFRAAKLLKHLRASVVHSFMFDAEMVGRIAGRIAGTRAVICSNRCPHLARARHKLWLARWTRGLFDKMIANSWAGLEFERDVQGVNAARLCVTPNGVDIERFHPGDALGLRDELGIPKGNFVVGMFAHFRANKNHRTFIKAAAKIASTRKDVSFLMVGQADGLGKDDCFGASKQLVEKLEISNRVLFLGARSDVDRLYRILDIKVLSSLFEGTPNVVLEAMASGIPVIASDVSDNARIIQDGRTGYVVPKSDTTALAERIVHLLDNEGLRKQMGVNARRRVEQEFSVAALGHRTAEVYLDVLRQKGALAQGDYSAMLLGGKA